MKIKVQFEKGALWNKETHYFLPDTIKRKIETFLICNKTMGYFKIALPLIFVIFQLYISSEITPVRVSKKRKNERKDSKKKRGKKYNQMETSSDSSVDIQDYTEGSAEIIEDIKISEDSYD